MKRSVGVTTGEEIVLGELVAFMPAGATPSEIDSRMLACGDESMSLSDVTDALVRCVEKGEAERVGTVTYRITEKGRARLRGEG